MSKSYTIKVNDSYEFSFDEASIKESDIVKKTKKHFHLIEKNITYKVKRIKSNFPNKSYKLAVNGNIYEIQINSQLDQLIDKMGLVINGKQKDNDIKAPMPGLILEVLVTEKQEVKEGDTLLVLEAMKMENMLTAPKDGIVKSITVNKGDAVDKKQLLIEME